MNTTLDNSIKRAQQLKNYRPTKNVNNVMSDLVYNITHAENHKIEQVTQAQQKDIRRICSEAEYELEVYWSRKIATSRNPNETLMEFPYLHNYSILVNREAELLQSVGLQLNANHKVLIIGSGPLPLTYMELLSQTGATIDLLDSSAEAIEMSKQFCSSLNLTPAHIHAQGKNVTLAQKYDVIFLAALAGASDKDKQAIVDNILQYLKDDGKLIARSAAGIRTLLYPPILSPFKGLQLVAENHPTDEVINSILIYTKEKNEE
jgi:nicotianamine synthase